MKKQREKNEQDNTQKLVQGKKNEKKTANWISHMLL